MTTETIQQVCNQCAKPYPPGPEDNPTNPLCVLCRLAITELMDGYKYAIMAALSDRGAGFGLMARMGDERFTRYVVRRVELFNEARARLG